MKKHEKIRPIDTSVDYRYQRELDVRRAEVIGQNWDPNLAGVPVVSRRGVGILAKRA